MVAPRRDRTLPRKSTSEEQARAEQLAAEAASLEEQLAERTKLADGYYQALRRVCADFENYKKRAEAERGEIIRCAAQEVAGRLLPVLDDLERAIATAENCGPGNSLLEGVRMVHRAFMEVLRSEGVAPVESVGKTFDPRLHQAVAMVDVTDGEGNVVVEELRRGYTMRGRVLRPALVAVSRRGDGGCHAGQE